MGSLSGKQGGHGCRVSSHSGCRLHRLKCLKRLPLRARTGYKQVSGFSLEYSKADGTLTTLCCRSQAAAVDPSRPMEWPIGRSRNLTFSTSRRRPLCARLRLFRRAAPFLRSGRSVGVAVNGWVGEGFRMPSGVGKPSPKRSLEDGAILAKMGRADVGIREERSGEPVKMSMQLFSNTIEIAPLRQQTRHYGAVATYTHAAGPSGQCRKRSRICCLWSTPPKNVASILTSDDGSSISK